MKNLAEGFRSVLPAVRRQPDLVSSTVINLYKSYMGRNAPRLPAVRFHNGILFLTAINASWKKEGKNQEKSIIKLLNSSMKEDLVKEIHWVPWPEKFRKKEEAPEKEVILRTLPPEYQKSLEEVKDDKVREALRKYLNRILP